MSIGAALGKSLVNFCGLWRNIKTDTGLVVEKLEGSTVAVRNDGLEGDPTV